MVRQPLGFCRAVRTESDLSLVRVEAVSVNPVDTRVRAPKDKVEAEPKVLGWDAAGVVEAVGSAVTRFKVGDEVYYAGDLTRPGCNAEFLVVDERIVGHKPKTLSFAILLPTSIDDVLRIVEIGPAFIM